MFGLLNFNKPPGMTSRDVVNRVKWLIDPFPAGHAGTLDPLATGVLVVAVGRATRLIEYLQRYPKRYRGVFQFGQTSDTEDIDGEITPLADARVPSREEIETLLPRFRGEILQRPPAFSAILVKGKRSYKRARRGEQIEHAPRPVTIYSLELIAFDYPRLELDIRCSSGTYIRSLGRDLAESLGTGAVMAELQRTEIGPFHADQSIPLNPINRATIQASLLPALMSVCDLPKLQLTGPEWVEILAGRLLAMRPGLESAAEIAAVAPNGQLGAILVPRSGVLGPERVFPPEK